MATEAITVYVEESRRSDFLQLLRSLDYVSTRPVLTEEQRTMLRAEAETLRHSIQPNNVTDDEINTLIADVRHARKQSRSGH